MPNIGGAIRAITDNGPGLAAARRDGGVDASCRLCVDAVVVWIAKADARLADARLADARLAHARLADARLAHARLAHAGAGRGAGDAGVGHDPDAGGDGRRRATGEDGGDEAMNAEASSKVTATHLGRDAYLYVRQSTLHQVFENQESTRRQYDLRQRAVALGWPAERVIVIDSDLGQSGASAQARAGFQRLVSVVGMGRAGVGLKQRR